MLAQGEVIEEGTHEELLAKEGRYYKLWEMQQGNFVIKEDEQTEQETELPAFEESDEDEISYT